MTATEWVTPVAGSAPAWGRKWGGRAHDLVSFAVASRASKGMSPAEALPKLDLWRYPMVPSGALDWDEIRDMLPDKLTAAFARQPGKATASKKEAARLAKAIAAAMEKEGSMRESSPLRGVNDLLEQVVVVLAQHPVTMLEPRAHVLLERIRESWPEGEWIDIRNGYAWEKFMQRVGVQKDLYMNDQELRRTLWDLIEASLLEGDPQKAVRWSEE